MELIPVLLNTLNCQKKVHEKMLQYIYTNLNKQINFECFLAFKCLLIDTITDTGSVPDPVLDPYHWAGSGSTSGNVNRIRVAKKLYILITYKSTKITII